MIREIADPLSNSVAGRRIAYNLHRVATPSIASIENESFIIY